MTAASAFLAAAAGEIGYLEAPAGSNRTKFAAEAGHANGYPWCATFLVAIAARVGLELPSTSAYTPAMANGFRAAGRWHTTPQPGDFAFFDFPDNVRRIQHVAVVEAVNPDGSLTTIEGNTSPSATGSQANGGGVWRRRRARGLVLGYGRPAYAPALPAHERRAVVVRNHVRTLVAPNGGLWHLQADGGIITATDGDASPDAPYLGSLPQLVAERKITLADGARAVDLLPFRAGYMIVVRHPGDEVTAYHFPAA
jgi:surface antigen